jgi:hypothetical protein
MKSASAKQQRTLVPIAVFEALDKLAHDRKSRATARARA